MRYHVTYAHSFSYLSALIVSSFLLFFQFLVPRNLILFLLSFFLSPTSFCLTTIRCRGVITLDHTQGHTTVGRTPLDEESIRRRDLYLTTHKHPYLRRDSNPQSQQAISRRSSFYTARPLESADFLSHWQIFQFTQ
jgi:hypothetical protein